MRYKHRLAILLGLLAALSAPRAFGENEDGGIRRVLLISIDGMHALDYQNCATVGTCPNLASLGSRGVTYTRASASKPSDSFPGLTNIVTGGTPKSHGAFYDLAYDRALAPPSLVTGNGLAAGNCTPNVFPGTVTEYEEGVEFNFGLLNGGAPGASLTEGGYKSIDSRKLPRDPAHNCNAVWPWNFLRVNTIFGVIHAAKGRTAWSDKHAVYASVSGPTGTATPSNLDDYYAPEINSNVVPLPGVTTPPTPNHPTGVSCATVRDTAHVGSWTDSFTNIQCYDTLKVNAVLNWIRGKSHLGAGNPGVPHLFGMNFQAVSVGQKLIEDGVLGGYTDNAGTLTPVMLDEIRFVDGAIGQMIAELNKQKLLESTLIVITAKHGQSPIDNKVLYKTKANSPAHLLTSYLPTAETQDPAPVEDDVSLLWLKDSSAFNVASAVGVLETAGNLAVDGVGEIFYGPSLTTMFNSPLTDSRSPDIIVQPKVGTIYSTSSTKQAEHGGFAHDDTNVMLLVSNPGLRGKTVTTAVETTQVAPTILKVLGLNPNSLQAVQTEGTAVLPGLNLGN